MSKNVTFRDLSKDQMKGKGTILICLINGGHQFMTNVYFVPSIKSNILSLGQLLENDKKNLIAKVPMKGHRMFLLNIQMDVSKCPMTCLKDSSWY